MGALIKMDRKKAFILGFIVFLGVINVFVWISPYITNIPTNGFVHRARSISFDETFGVPVMGDLHGLSEAEAGALSTIEGYPEAGTFCGINPGADGPWKIWSDWEDSDSFMGKELNAEEDIFSGMKSFSYFNVFFVNVPVEGEYYICTGSDDGMILFMDGVRIAQYLDGERSCQLDDDITLKNLTAGNHYFLIIVYQVKSTTGFTLRIKNATLNETHRTDPDTAPVMLWDYDNDTSLQIPTLGIVTTGLSLVLIFALITIERYTKKKI